MKNILSIITLLLFAQSLFAQFGVKGNYQTMSASNWDKLINRFSSVEGIQPSTFSTGYSLGLDYWFRWKNKRIEFTPEVNYAAYNEAWSSSTSDVGRISATAYSLFFNTNFYFLNFDGDCDCPTFSKDGDLIQKGFFIQISPGYSFYNLKYDALTSATTSRDATASAFSVGLAAGLDIGVTNLITVTPIIGFRRHFGVEWEGLSTYFDSDETLSADDNTTDIMTYHAGLRIGIRLDQRNY